MRMSLELVVIAIVILVVALVMLTIFSTGITPIGALTDFTNNCRNAGKLSCETTGAAPFTWASDVNVAGEITSCQAKLGTFNGLCVNKVWQGS